MDRDPPTFGVLLRRYRLGAWLTQQALAERARLSLRGLSDLERGSRRTPYAGTVDRLVDALELGPMDRAILQTAGRRRSRAQVGACAAGQGRAPLGASTNELLVAPNHICRSPWQHRRPRNADRAGLR